MQLIVVVAMRAVVVVAMAMGIPRVPQTLRTHTKPRHNCAK